MSAIWDLVLVERAILTALGPLAGVRAEGTVIATATGDDVVLPPFTYGVPVIGGKAIYSRMVRVLPTTPINVEPVGPTVTSAGTAVAVRAVCGGVAGNLPADTPIIWQPQVEGMLARGAVGPGGVTGGVKAEGYGRCARVVAFDALPQKEATKAVWEAQGEGFPAIVLSFVNDRTVALRSVASAEIEHTWRAYIVSTNYLDNDERQIEGKLLVAAVRDVLQGLADQEGDIFSGVPVEIGAVQALAFSPSSHVFAVDIVTTDAPKRTDVRLTDGVSWQPWETTRIRIGEVAADPLPQIDVTDTTTEHEQ
jgi:hypothetical protein